MNTYTEKRDCERCQLEVPVSCGYFNSDYFFPAKMTNHSIEGLCLTSDHYLRPGGGVYFRVEYFSPDTLKSKDCRCRRVRTLALAEVKWCKEIANDGDSLYAAGLRYFELPY
jgi:hypothetical protein